MRIAPSPPARSKYARFALFLAVGGVNTLVNYLLFLLLIFFGSSQDLAVVVSWLIGIAFNFCTTGRIVFRSSDGRLLPRFAGIYLLQLALNVLLLRLATSLGVPTYFAQALLLAALAVLTYLMLRQFVFNRGRAELAEDRTR
jgi:putative flippase GtrA